MKRIATTPRPQWQETCESLGFTCHTLEDDIYWNESAYYELTSDEVDALEEATEELYRICLEAVDHVVQKDRLGELGIPPALHPLVRESWARADPSLYGRFDLTFGEDGNPKMFEFNADTPTSLLEASVVQWQWLEDKFPAADQFNSIHEGLLEGWQWLRKEWGGLVHFASVEGHKEDFDTTRYLQDTAAQSGFETVILSVEELGYDATRGQFVDLELRDIRALFKLYPWEWLASESFFEGIAKSHTHWLEPIWRSVLSCKGILPVLWQLFPNHPNLLKASFERGDAEGRAVRKPIYGREGSQVMLLSSGGKADFEFTGQVESDRYVYQARCDLPCFEGRYPVIGSWIIGGRPRGVGIREDKAPITTNTSHFVPHIFR